MAERITRLVLDRFNAGHQLRILGITGPPGTGKTTVATMVAAMVATRGITVAGLAPMDGFHMSNAVLDDLDRHWRKGAPDTFDVWGFAALLKRIRRAEHEVLAPDYRRDLHEPVAAGLRVAREGLVVTEGNYLALDAPGWHQVRSHIDLLVHIDTPLSEVGQRLVARHMAFGKDRLAASHWVRTVDGPNIALVDACRDRADVVISAH
nr:nucleoside-triphosphatase [Schaalia suimastitidis]